MWRVHIFSYYKNTMHARDVVYIRQKKKLKLSLIVNPSLVFVNRTNSISVIEQCENLNDLFFVESETIT